MCENRRILLINQSRSCVSSARLLSTNQQYCSQDIGARSVLRCPHFKRLLTILTPHAIYITWNSYTLNIIFIYSSYVGITFANSHEKVIAYIRVFVIDIRAKGNRKIYFFLSNRVDRRSIRNGENGGGEVTRVWNRYTDNIRGRTVCRVPKFKFPGRLWRGRLSVATNLTNIYIYIGWLTSMPIDARSASPLAPFSALLRLSIVDG